MKSDAPRRRERSTRTPGKQRTARTAESGIDNDNTAVSNDAVIPAERRRLNVRRNIDGELNMLTSCFQ